MNNCNWTAGPWMIDRYGRIVSDSSEWAYGMITVHGLVINGGSEAKANAHLIAAAPELYSALDALISHPGVIMPPRLWDEARRALAKARGETE